MLSIRVLSLRVERLMWRYRFILTIFLTRLLVTWRRIILLIRTKLRVRPRGLLNLAVDLRLLAS